ncbi:MAG: GNAT family N-acetyltransferase [Actinomycetota bacterium]|nr:GNAT family N-acetyltransferase [Actinomycetota bacterium]
MRFVDIDPGDPLINSDVLPVLVQLRPHLDAESFAAVYAEGAPQGLRLTAAYDGEGDEEALAGVVCWRILATTTVIRKLYVDALVANSSVRSRGTGQALFEYLEQKAKDADCATIELDSGVQRFDAHRFYMRQRMSIGAHHFTKNISKDA